MVCELFREIWQDPHAQEFGRQGQKQDGIDIIGCRSSNKKYEAVQATIETPLTKTKIKNDYESSKILEFELDCFIIAATSPRDVELQKYAVRLSSTGKLKVSGTFCRALPFPKQSEAARFCRLPGQISLTCLA